MRCSWKALSWLGLVLGVASTCLAPARPAFALDATLNCLNKQQKAMAKTFAAAMKCRTANLFSPGFDENACFADVDAKVRQAFAKSIQKPGCSFTGDPILDHPGGTVAPVSIMDSAEQSYFEAAVETATGAQKKCALSRAKIANKTYQMNVPSLRTPDSFVKAWRS